MTLDFLEVRVGEREALAPDAREADGHDDVLPFPLDADQQPFTPPRVSHMSADLERQVLRQLDTAGVEPTSHAVPMVNVFRDDEPRPCLSPEEMLANAPDRSGEFFRVPRIIED